MMTVAESSFSELEEEEEAVARTSDRIQNLYARVRRRAGLLSVARSDPARRGESVCRPATKSRKRRRRRLVTRENIGRDLLEGSRSAEMAVARIENRSIPAHPRLSRGIGE